MWTWKFLPILILAAAGLFASAAPVVYCPLPRHRSIGTFVNSCPRCGDRGTITLLNQWLWKPATAEEREELKELDWSTEISLAQDLTPEKTLEAIEETLLKARTLKVDVKGDIQIQFKDDLEKVGVTASLRMAQGDRLSYSILLARPEGNRDRHMVSNGTILKEAGKTTEMKTPADLNRIFGVAALTRVGINNANISVPREQDEENDYNLKKKFSNDQFAFGPDEGGKKSLKFRTVFGPMLSEVRLLYDASTLLPAERHETYKLPTALVTIHEVYGPYVIGADIPESEFTLAAAKTVRDEIAKLKGFAEVRDRTPIEEQGELYNGIVAWLHAAAPAALAGEAAPVEYARYAKNPGELRGKPIKVSALFLQSNPLRLERLAGGVEWIHRTYVSDLSGNQGYVFDLLEAPPAGLKARDPVQLEGVFFRLATYEGRKGPIEAPQLLGKSLVRTK